MKKIFLRLCHWLQQPTTLSGLSMLIGGAMGIRSSALSQDMGCTLMGAALPLLLPDNTTARRIAQAALVPLSSTLLKHSHSTAPSEKRPDTETSTASDTGPQKHPF